MTLNKKIVIIILPDIIISRKKAITNPSTNDDLTSLFTDSSESGKSVDDEADKTRTLVCIPG